MKRSHGHMAGSDDPTAQKDVFMVDLGHRALTPKLQNQLSQYNARVPVGHIKELDVMSDDGRSFEKIVLKAK